MVLGRPLDVTREADEWEVLDLGLGPEVTVFAPAVEKRSPTSREYRVTTGIVQNAVPGW